MWEVQAGLLLQRGVPGNAKTRLCVTGLQRRQTLQFAPVCGGDAEVGFSFAASLLEFAVPP